VATTFDLSGKSILITGAGRGLGRALAIGAAQAGAAVAALDLDAALLAELKRTSPSIATYVVDVVDRAAFMAAAAQIGRIDAVVNNAMLIRYDAIEAVDEPVLDRMLAIGIKGAVWGVQALLRHMDPAAGGVVLNLASPTAERGFPTTAVYSMVKGAMGTLTRMLFRTTASSTVFATFLSSFRRFSFPRFLFPRLFFREWRYSRRYRGPLKRTQRPLPHHIEVRPQPGNTLRIQLIHPPRPGSAVCHQTSVLQHA